MRGVLRDGLPELEFGGWRGAQEYGTGLGIAAAPSQPLRFLQVTHRRCCHNRFSGCDSDPHAARNLDPLARSILDTQPVELCIQVLRWVRSVIFGIPDSNQGGVGGSRAGSWGANAEHLSFPARLAVRSLTFEKDPVRIAAGMSLQIHIYPLPRLR